LEQREPRVLAPYAQLSAETRGREHAEPPPEWRTHYQRDRDRIIHSRAFRRLEYKTQVFLNGTGDHLRTRLTHTMEVAAIARNLARALRANEDLAEAIALAHDLGHPPFGHTGEAVLNRLMRRQGGFEHNRQSLRVVEELEQKYPGFPGLNLSWEVREGLCKHSAGERHFPRPPGFAPRCPSLEAQLADLADEIAYYSHDLDDGLETGLLSEQRLERDVRLWRQAARQVRRDHGPLPDECRRFFTVRCLIEGQVRDVVRHTLERLEGSGVTSADAVRRQRTPLAGYSARRKGWNSELRRYLYKNLYYNRVVHDVNSQAGRWLEALFRHYARHPDDLARQTGMAVPTAARQRVLCDYLAGMTDRYAIQECARLLGLPPNLAPSLPRDQRVVTGSGPSSASP
jgi:dGTPase